MIRVNRQSGRTLVEMAIVIAVVVFLGGLGLPAVRSFLDSFESGTSARPVVSAALASARAIAAKEQKYAGIRFQKAFHSEGPLKASQYMIFIVNDFDRTGLVSGFRAVEGLKPIKLPDSIGVMDYELINQKIISDPTWEPSSNHPVDITDLTTFSIIFSPSGKLVIHDVQVRNRDGIPDSLGELGNPSADDVFNKKDEVDNGIGMFYQDDYFGAAWSHYPLLLGWWQEPSQRAFMIYDRREFKNAYEKGRAYSQYLIKLMPDAIYINPYTGTMVEK
jgi:type II secretory pathway pseudopilin PulG